MLNFLAQNSNFIGEISPPISGLPSDPNQAFNLIIAFLLKLFIFGASIMMGVYLLLGALDWITSGGEKEKLAKAQGKMTNAVIGLFLLFIVLAIFCTIYTQILRLSDNCLEFNLPRLQ